MKNILSTLSFALLLCPAALLRAQILDSVVFGDPASEAAHAVNAPLTQVIAGGLGQPARKLHWNPADTTTREGGYIHFNARVDPVALNYVTLKLWGSDTNRTASGILLLYQIEAGQLLQVGYRDQQVAEFSPLAWGTRPEAGIPGRFYYTTIPLPLSMTQGRTQVELRVVGAELNANGSLPVYRAYVHLGAYFQPAPGDPQGAAPAPAPIRPSSGNSWQASYDRARQQTITNMTSWLANNNGDLNQLVDGFNVAWTPAYQNALIPPRLVAQIDTTARAYFANPGLAGGAWGGAYGPQGERIKKIGAAAFGAALDEVVDLGDPAGPATRRVLWSKMLKASRDAGRFGRRGPTTNQSIICDKEIYNANEGLRVLGSADAFTEPRAKQYLLEAVGLLPWPGPDLAAGGTNSFMGSDYYLVTPAGLTKENGYVSAYGEVYDVNTAYYGMTGDEQFKTQAVKMLRARSYFRYPMVDEDGYRSFRMVGPLDWRAHQTFPFDAAYGERGGRLAVALATKDPHAIGYVHQMFDDNQGLPFGTDLAAALALETLLAEPDSGERLPMTEGQPDFAWADVDNGVVAIKRGEELTWIEPFWQSRTGLHSMARTFQITPTAARMASVRSDLQFSWSGLWSSKVNGTGWNGVPLATPAGLVHQAYFGDKILQAVAPADAQATREEFIGRASFYSTRYGRYLVGINMDQTRSFVLKTPVGFTSAPELISRQTVSGTVTVAPFSAVVLDLGVDADANPRPDTPKFLVASPSDGGVVVLWETSAGATRYNLHRAPSASGPFTPIATGLGATYPKKWAAWPAGTFTDLTTAPGNTYFYKVTAVNTAGESYDSPITPGVTPGAAVPSVNTLPDPWKNVNFAATGTGTASYDAQAQAFSFAGATGDFWSTADGGHFVYRRLVGDGTLVARLTSVGGAIKTGLMIRDSLAANSAHTAIIRNNANVTGHRRNAAGQGTAYLSSAVSPQPLWLKLERVGKTITLTWAPDVSGAPGAWSSIGTATPELGAAAYIGLISTAGTPVFDHVTFTPVLDATPAAPAAPTGFAATAGNGQVVLRWLPADRASSYTVKRASTAGGPFTTVVATNLAALTFTDTGLTNATTQHYVVTATNALGEGPASAVVSATPTALPAAPAGVSVAVNGTQATVTWQAAAGASTYTLQRSLDGVSWTPVQTDIAGTSAADTGLAPGFSYVYAVTATNAQGSSLASTAVTATPVPAAPLWIRAAGDAGRARLTWTTAAGATHYRVKRASHRGGTYVAVSGDLQSPTFTDDGLATGADTFYVVTALNAAGEGVASTETKLGWGTGLRAEYFNNTANAGSAVLLRLDTTPGAVDFGQNSPGPGINSDNFSVLWTGWLEAPTSETYTFAVRRLDDGFRLWIDGTTVLDSSAGVRTGTYTLTADQKHEVRAQYWDGTGAAFVDVVWSSPTTAPEALPVHRLYPADPLLNRAAGGAATASVSDAGNEAARAFDSNSGSKWLTPASTSSGWLQYQFAGASAWPVTQYRLTSGNDQPLRDPAGWTLLGSADGVAWTTLDTRSAQSFAQRTLTKPYSPTVGPAPFAFYRLDITANAGGAGQTLQLAELGLFSPEELADAPAASAQTTSGQIALSWPAVPGATSYTVRRSAYAGGPYTAIATGLGANTYTDDGLADGRTYHYIVSAMVGVLEGEASTSVGAVVGVPGSETPTLTGPSAAAATVGTPFDYPIAATGTPVAYTASGLPPGLGLLAATGRIAGTPTTAGEYRVTLGATNATGTGWATLVLNVAKGTAQVALADLVQPYDGTPRAVSATTAPAGTAVTIRYDGSATAPVYPGTYAVTATAEDAHYAGVASGTLVVRPTALVRHAPTLNADLEGSLQVLSPENVVLNSSAAISGDLLAPGTPTVQLNGTPTYGSTLEGPGAAAPAGYTVTLNTGSVLRHIVRRVDPLTLPAVAAPPAPAGTRDVFLNTAAQAIGDPTTLRDLTFNSGAGSRAVPAGTYGSFTVHGGTLVLGVAGATEPAVYNLQNLVVNSGGAVQVAGPVTLTVASGVTFNAGVGAAGHPEWLTLRVAAGGVTLNSGVALHAHVNAPSGTVTINGGATLHGTVASDRLTLNGTGLLADPAL